ncbi:MAG: hypothetical protein WCA08_19760 [Desulfoferrobacter sp.]
MTAEQKAAAEKIMRDVPVAELKEALINEYRRRIIRYKLLDESMKKKYGMTFEDFESRNIVKERGFSWQVESDSMEWEHAVEGMRYAEEKLKGLHQV